MIKDGFVHMLIEATKTSQEVTSAISRDSVPAGFEYIFKVISERFSYISVDESGFQMPGDPEGMFSIILHATHVPFQNNENPLANQSWNTLVASVIKDFEAMIQKNEWNINYAELKYMISECWEDFDVIDRERLDVDNLTNLILFVMDFCRLTLFTSRIHPNLFDHLYVYIKIKGKEYPVSKRTSDRIKKYLKEPLRQIDDNKMINYTLPQIIYDEIMPNPQVRNKRSYLAAMFIDIMHNFFLSIGLKKWGNAEWSSAETTLLYEVLRFYGVCKSSKPAKNSTYVKTILNDYCDYFEKCKLHSWLRSDQEYSYLMSKKPNEIFSTSTNYDKEKE